MKTEIRRQGEMLIVNIEGHLDFESAIPLRDDLNRMIRNKTEAAPERIVVNLSGLEFVGSSGISAFIQTLKEFNQSAPVKPRYCHVKSEFRRIIHAFDSAALFDFYESESAAISSPSVMDH